MTDCCGIPNVPNDAGHALPATGGRSSNTAPVSCPSSSPFAWFNQMIPNCLAYAKDAKQQGRPIVGIMCEYTPRELIMAAGGVPICLCGGSVKTIPAAEQDLPAGLCPLIKSTYGYHVQKSNPFLEMADLLVAETTCDGKKKMYELMGETRPMYILELPQKPGDPDALDHWRREVGKFKEHLESRFSVKVTDCNLRQAISTMNRERALRRQLAELMQAEVPPLTGRQLLGFKSSISGIPVDFEQYEEAISLLQNECSGRPPSRPSAGWDAGRYGHHACRSTADSEVGRCQGPHLPNNRVRVLLTGVPLPHGAERVLDIIEGSGGLVVCMENCTGLKPILEDVDERAPEPLQAIADKYFHLPCSVMTCNDGRLDLLRQLVEQYRPQCIIELVWQGCLTYDVESSRIRRLAEEELRLPYLKIQTDYSPSDSARISIRVEALFEMVRSAGPANPLRSPACER
jgi:benzoyl-CoA reductase/2-hydroxyglutaryl-CoA dehydratase subunit BcrC/BadD/HgdB